jgi:glycosyltransferase involved in cell wall biosynthesis
MKKNVLILSASDTHGAYEGAYRIAKFLYEAEYPTALVVRDKTKMDPFIIHVPIPGKQIVQRVINRLLPVKNNKPPTDEKYLFLNEDESKEYISAEAILSKLPFKPDLVLAGMMDGYGNTNLLVALKEKTNAKVYMITMDMAPLTGGCHYSWGCKGYENNCNNCPAILDDARKDWAYKNLRIKLSNVIRSDIRIISASGWTYRQARQSALFKNQRKIYNTNSFIDNRLFNNKNRNCAKNIFDIPGDVKLIFTGSYNMHDKRKGISYFIESLKCLWNILDDNLKNNTYILIAGMQPENHILSQIPFKKHVIDFIKDYRLLALAYQASDVFVCASIEDSGPMMVSEALACGTPVVGFEMGVVSNMVKNGYNGYKAELKNSNDLAAGLYKILSLTEEEFNTYSYNAIKQVEECSSQATLLNIVDKIINGTDNIE